MSIVAAEYGMMVDTKFVLWEVSVPMPTNKVSN